MWTPPSSTRPRAFESARQRRPHWQLPGQLGPLSWWHLPLQTLLGTVHRGRHKGGQSPSNAACWGLCLEIFVINKMQKVTEILPLQTAAQTNITVLSEFLIRLMINHLYLLSIFCLDRRFTHYPYFPEEKWLFFMCTDKECPLSDRQINSASGR